MLVILDLSQIAPSWVAVGIVQEVIAYLVRMLESLVPQEATLLEHCRSQVRLFSRLASGQCQWEECGADWVHTTRVLEVE